LLGDISVYQIKHLFYLLNLTVHLFLISDCSWRSYLPVEVVLWQGLSR